MKIRNTIAVIFLCSIYLLSPGHAVACELLGFSFNESVQARHIFSAFRHRGEENPDGWGVSFYRDKSVTLFKEAGNASESALAGFLATYEPFRGKLLVAHVRRATVGHQSHQNTHPFVRELSGKEYTLAHNGTLKEFQSKLKLSRITPLGINDSEFLLCYLLGRIESKGVVEWDGHSFEWLHEELRNINGTGTLNCLLSDGTYLFAYHDKDGYNELHHLRRMAPHTKAHFNDLSKEIELSSVYPNSATGVIVATRPLTDEGWVEFAPGELLVFKDGTQVFPNASR